MNHAAYLPKDIIPKVLREADFTFKEAERRGHDMPKLKMVQNGHNWGNRLAGSGYLYSVCQKCEAQIFLFGGEKEPMGEAMTKDCKEASK